MIQFAKITSTKPVADYLTNTLTSHLSAGQRVLWLVPGGSSIAVAAAVSRQLSPELLGNLTVTLTDERYGAVGHPDSNWRQLDEAGFALPGATLLPVLTGIRNTLSTPELTRPSTIPDSGDAATTAPTDPATLQDVAARWGIQLKEALAAADFRLGFFGIGADGHTAGMLPGSPAITTTEYAAGYDAGKFQRLTMTIPAIAHLDEAVAYAVGDSKWPVIDELATQSIEPAKQPAQALKLVHTLTIFNDHFESK